MKDIQYWATMLNEAFDKRSDNEKAENAFPADENAKFTFEEVFTDDIDDPKKVEQVFDKIWPKWSSYFENQVGKEDYLELEGQRRDVDDWDVWKIRVEDCYGGMEEMIDMMFDDLPSRWDNNHSQVTLKEIVDTEIKRLIDEAGEKCDLDTLERNGQCIYRGSYRTGGAYPDA